MKHTLTAPCKFCPFLTGALPGYLGGAQPDEFSNVALGESGMACHIDLEKLREFWANELVCDDLAQELISKDVQQCVGALAFATKMCKSFRDEGLETQRRIVGRLSNVMSRDEFIFHHSADVSLGDRHEKSSRQRR